MVACGLGYNRGMLQLLNALPFNGYKSYLGLTLIALVLGLAQMGHVDQATADTLVQWLSIFTGVALTHKLDKKQ